MGWIETIRDASFATPITIDDVNMALAGYIPISHIGEANGVASLDVNGKVPVGQLPEAVVGALKFQGTYNAATNTPALQTASNSNLGWYYVVSVAGNGYAVGDWVLNANGSAWTRLDAQDAVSSVAGKTGAVTLVPSDIVGLGALAQLSSVGTSQVIDGSVTAAKLNQMSAANGQALVWNGSAWVPTTIAAGGDYTWVFKTADEPVTNSGTLQQDDHLFFTAQANKIYSIKLHLIYEDGNMGGSVAGCLIQPSMPEGIQNYRCKTTSILSTGNPATLYSSESTSYYSNFGGGASNYLNEFDCEIVIEIGNTSGVVAFNWAQWSPSATSSKVLKGSYLAHKKLN